MSLRTFIATLLPHLHGLRLDQASITDAGLTLVLATTRRTACCPLCSRRSARIHSRYQRTLADLPWGGHSVTLRVEVRRFFCRNRRCARAIFAERLPELAASHARRTNAQHALLLDIACALGGQPGARLALRHGVATSRATLLRLVHRAPLPPVGMPRVLGVDDWSQRRGRTYGTILIDAERHRPIDLLPDRTAATLASWLEAHPSVEVVTRDRSTAYAEGATRGAPNAQQVADKFHLFDDLGDAVERVLDQHRSALRELTLPSSLPILGETSSQPATTTSSAGSAGRPTRHTHGQLQRRALLRIDRYERLQALKHQGVDDWGDGPRARN